MTTAPRKTQILVALGLGLGLTQLHCADGAAPESGDSSSDAGGSSPEAGADSNGSADGTLQGVDASPNAGDATSDSPDDAASDAPHDAGPEGEGGDGGLSIAWNAFLPLASGTSTDGGAGTTPDISGHGYNATYSFGITFVGSAMVLTGGGLVSVPPASSIPALNLTGSYSVSVWVTISNVSGFQTFVSADGTQVSEFYLQLANGGHFAFALSYSDSDQGAQPSCVADAPSVAPQVGTPYHLAATRNAATGIDYLYVNGAISGAATCPSTTGVAWLASTFGIGHGVFSGSPTDFVSGSISGVGFVDRELTGAEVAKLYSFGPQYRP